MLIPISSDSPKDCSFFSLALFLSLLISISSDAELPMEWSYSLHLLQTWNHLNHLLCAFCLSMSHRGDTWRSDNFCWTFSANWTLLFLATFVLDLFISTRTSFFSVTPVYRHIFLVRFKVTGVIQCLKDLPQTLLLWSSWLFEFILSVFIIKAPIATRNSSSPNKVQVGRRRAGSGRPRSQPWKVTWSHGHARCQTKYFLWVKSLSLKRPKLYFPVIIPTLQDRGKWPVVSRPGTINCPYY